MQAPIDSNPQTATQRIDAKLQSLGDWRASTLGQLRELIHQAIPAVTEEWKWDTPVWSSSGILCTGETYKGKVKLTFPKGATLQDKCGLFNASLEGNARRAIDIMEGQVIDPSAFKDLIREAAALNASAKKTKPKRAKPT